MNEQEREDHIFDTITDTVAMLYDEGFVDGKIINQKSPPKGKSTKGKTLWTICFSCDEFEVSQTFHEASILRASYTDLFHCLMATYQERFNEREDHD